MERRSSKHPVLCGKSHSGCMWQLIRILNFCQADSNRKLISDGRHFSRHVVGTGCSRSRLNLRTTFVENCQDIDEGAGCKSQTVDNGERSVKKLMGKEMLSEQLLEKLDVAPKLKHFHSDCGHVDHIKNCKKANKACRRPHQSPVHRRKQATSVGHQQPSNPSSMEKSSNKLNLAEMLEAFCNQVHPENQGHYTDVQRYDQLTEINLQQLQMSESSLKKLQDPDFLFTTQVHELLDSHTETEKDKFSTDDNFSEYGIANSKKCKEPACNMKFKKPNTHILFRKIRSQHSHPSKGSDDPRPSSNRILVLKSDPKGMKSDENTVSCYASLQSHYSLGNRGHGVKPSYFSFSDLKKKFKNAMRENRKVLHRIPVDGTLRELPCEPKNATEKTRTAKSSTCAKRGDGLEFASINESLCRKLTVSTVSYSKQLEFNMNLEAKRHLSERLNKVDMDRTYLSKQNPRSLGRILSSPEHDFLVTLGPKGDKEHGFVSSQMRFSPYSNFQKADESSWQLQEENKMNCLSPLRRNASAPSSVNHGKHDDQLQIFESKPNSPEKLCNSTVWESICSARGNSISNSSVKIEETDGAQPGDFNLLAMPLKAYSTIVTSAGQREGVANICEEFGYQRCSKLDLSLENKPLTSSLSIHKTGVVDNKDGEEHPSPVSVLEPPFIDDVTIHRGTIPKPAELGMQPLQVDFEEQSLSVYPLNLQINSNASLIDHVHISQYVRAVLQASGLNWDELSLMQQSSDQPLLPTYLMELFPVKSCCDHKLLFDCIDEVLLDAYQCYFGSSPWVLFLEPKIRPASLEDNVAHGVMKSVHWYLFPPLTPRTLDQIVGNDVTKSRTWIDVRLDAEGIVTDIVEAILEELKMETTWEIQI